MFFSSDEPSLLTYAKPSADLPIDTDCVRNIRKTVAMQKLLQLLIDPAGKTWTLIYKRAVNLHQISPGPDAGIRVLR
jgi:hypothetical protein